MIPQIWEIFCVLSAQGNCSSLEESIKKPGQFHNYNSVISLPYLYWDYKETMEL